MSKKRRADKQITKDDNLDAENPDDNTPGAWKPADSEALKNRTIYKIKRSAGARTTSSAPRPAFNLTAPGTEEGKASESISEPESKEKESEETTPAAAPQQENAFAKILNRQPGDWDCSMCTLMNKANDVRCISCEEWKPGHAPESGQGTDSGSAEGSIGENGFTFGASTDSTGGDTFTFGGEPSTAASTQGDGNSSGGFTFGGESSSTGGAEEAFSFGSAGDFNMGDAAAGGGFSFGSVTGDESTFGGDSGTTEGASSFDKAGDLGSSTVSTAEMFKDVKPEPRGDDQDETIHRVHCRVYRMGPQMKRNEDGSETLVGQAFLEQGQGELRLNKISEDGKKSARALMRADKTHRLVLNAPLFDGMKKGLRGEVRLQFVSSDLDGKPAVYLLKFGSAEETTEAEKKMDECISYTKAE